MIGLPAPASVSFDGYKILSAGVDFVGSVVTIAYQQTLQGSPIDSGMMGALSVRLTLEAFEAMPGTSTALKASHAVASTLNLPTGFTVTADAQLGAAPATRSSTTTVQGS